MGTYSQEFKDEIVALHRTGGRTFMELAKEFNLSATTVGNWVRAAERRDPNSKAGPVNAESDQVKIARLERELARKSEELDILGKALAFFARRMDR